MLRLASSRPGKAEDQLGDYSLSLVPGALVIR